MFRTRWSKRSPHSDNDGNDFELGRSAEKEEVDNLIPKISGGDPVGGTGPSSSTSYRLAAFFSLVVISIATQITFKLSQHNGRYGYNTASAMCVVELTKLAVAVIHHYLEVRQQRNRNKPQADFAHDTYSAAVAENTPLLDLRRALEETPVLLFCEYLLLAFSYAVYNQLIFAVMYLADPGTFSLLKSFNPAIVGVLSWWVQGISLTEFHWYCILIQIFGIIPVIFSMDAVLDRNKSGILLMAFVCLMSSFLSVYNSKIVRGGKTSLAVQNIILYSFGTVFNLIGYLALDRGSGLSFFQGYANPYVLLLLVLNSCAGIAISALYKYGDAVLKTFAQPLCSAVVVYLSSIFFGVPIDAVKAAGSGTIIVASILYLRLPATQDEGSTQKKQGATGGAKLTTGFITLVISLCIFAGCGFIVFNRHIFAQFSTELIDAQLKIREQSFPHLRERSANSSTCVVEQPRTGRVALLLIGEALRDTTRQGGRRTCGPGSEAVQRDVAANHLKNIVEPMELSGYNVEIFGVTYPCTNGSSAQDFLHSAYEGRFTALNATFPKPKESFGGQVHSMRAIAEMVIDRIDSGRGQPYEQLMFFRWDILPSTPLDANCTVGNPTVVARDNSNIRGWETNYGLGKINIDFVHMFPGAFLPCFLHLTRDRPTDCCKNSCMGMACTHCMNTLNVIAGANQTLAPTTGCPKEMFRQGKSAADVRGPHISFGTPGRQTCIDGKWVYAADNGTVFPMEEGLRR
jgi:hypothetical protein